MVHSYSNVMLFPIMYLVGLGEIFLVWLEMNLNCFSAEILKGVGIKSPHINKTFLGSSGTKCKAG